MLFCTIIIPVLKVTLVSGTSHTNFSQLAKDYCSAGDTVRVLDTSASEYWRVQSCFSGSVGLVPASYLLALEPGEKVCQVTCYAEMEGLWGQRVSLDKDQVELN